MSGPYRKTAIQKFSIACLGASAIVAASLGSQSALAAPRGGFHGGGTLYRAHGGFGGGYHRRGLGVGAAVGLGVLGAAAAGVAASQYYNGYPAYSGGYHPGYGYDYYPDHGYYGPY
jgi:hypothetical protein